jgi:hypothetical protein
MSSRSGRAAVLAFALLLLALAAPLAPGLSPSSDAAAYGGISIQLDRPTFAGKEQVVMCTLTVTGGPAEDGSANFSYKAEIVADNATGSLVTPSSGSSSTGVFKINVTMPKEAPQTIKVKVNATSKGGSPATSKYLEQEFEIKVVDPIVITATVYNMGSIDAKNVTARFFADGELLGSRVFNVTALSHTQLVYNWTFEKISSGKHVVTIYVDDPNELVEFSEGNNVYSLTIYVGNEGNPLGAVLTIGVIIASVFAGLMWLQKPPRRGTTKKF